MDDKQEHFVYGHQIDVTEMVIQLLNVMLFI